MRALLVMAVIVTLGGVAHADMIDIQDPPIVMACPHATTWPLVLACVKQHGLAVTVVRALDDANLVALTTNDKAATFQGFVLYVHPDTGPWRIGGLTQNAASPTTKSCGSSTSTSAAIASTSRWRNAAPRRSTM